MALDDSTAITLYGMQCWDEGTEEEFGRDGSTATRTILCHWTDRISLANYLLGATVVTGLITSTLPTTPYPDAPWMYASSVRSVGVAGDDGMTIGPNGAVAYKYSRLTITYRPDGDVLGSEDLDYSTDSITFPHEGAFKWGDGSLLLATENPRVVFSCAQYTRNILRQPRLPVDVIFSLLDTVNVAPFLGADIGTLRYLGCSSRRTFTVGGYPLWDLGHRFLWRSIDWRKVFRPDTGLWDTPVTTVGGHSLLGTGDYTRLGFTA